MNEKDTSKQLIRLSDCRLRTNSDGLRRARSFSSPPEKKVQYTYQTAHCVQFTVGWNVLNLKKHKISISK